jgi:hypothetical protein
MIAFEPKGRNDSPIRIGGVAYARLPAGARDDALKLNLRGVTARTHQDNE